ncbi:MAG: 4'-phosphopantetheinyl transferase superfamily protein [Clostridia bacterium]|nr:4'-phosphopantetheinyl transferase superfamily protein [Clostridia bacterium]
MKVFLLDIRRIEETETEVLRERFPLRMKEADSFRDRQDLLRKAGSTILLSYVFPDLTEDKLRYNEHGKPYIEGVEEFSVSHSGNYVCIIKDECPVGIDIETENEKNLKVIKRVFTDNEASYIAEDSAKFHLLWTRKESFFKMKGTGLNAGLKSVDTMDGRCHYLSFKYENCFISICSENELRDIEIEEVK